MSDIEIGLFSIDGILILIYAGMHVSIALTLLSFLGVWFIRGKWIVASKMLALVAADSISSYIFGVVPLFVLMGLLISVSGIGKDTFDVANSIFHRLRGGFSHCGGQCGICRGYRHLHRVRRRFHQGGGAGDDTAGL